MLMTKSLVTLVGRTENAKVDLEVDGSNHCITTASGFVGRESIYLIATVHK